MWQHSLSRWLSHCKEKWRLFIQIRLHSRSLNINKNQRLEHAHFPFIPFNITHLAVTLFQSRAKFEVYLQLAWGDRLETDTWHRRQQPIVKLRCYGKFKAYDYRVWYFLDITYITREQRQQISVVPTLSPFQLCRFTELPEDIWIKQLLIDENENGHSKIILTL